MDVTSTAGTPNQYTKLPTAEVAVSQLSPTERTVFLTIPVRVGRLVILFVRIVVGISPIVLIVILVLDNSVVATQAFVQTG